MLVPWAGMSRGSGGTSLAPSARRRLHRRLRRDPHVSWSATISCGGVPYSMPDTSADTVAWAKVVMAVTEHHFRPNFLVAFNAWIATHPFTNPSAQKCPTHMPEYIQPELAQTDHHLDKDADDLYEQGSTDGEDSDDYVRTTSFLASVFSLVGISGHFRLRAARIGLITVGGAILVATFGGGVLMPPTAGP